MTTKTKTPRSNLQKASRETSDLAGVIVRCSLFALPNFSDALQIAGVRQSNGKESNIQKLYSKFFAITYYSSDWSQSLM